MVLHNIRFTTTSELIPHIKDPSIVIKPNAHPYAMKTTFTGIFSRSSSSLHHQVHVPHSHNTTLSCLHLLQVVMSPQQNTCFLEHRYSRLLTSEESRFLLEPPFRLLHRHLEMEMKMERMMPPACVKGQNALIPFFHLPYSRVTKRPKTWSPTHLSATPLALPHYDTHDVLVITGLPYMVVSHDLRQCAIHNALQAGLDTCNTLYL